MKILLVKALFAALCIMNFTVHANTKILALIPDFGEFQIVLNNVVDELGPSYSVEVADMNKPYTVLEIAERCRHDAIQALLLMDFKAVTMALELQKVDSAFKVIPKFVSMTLIAKIATEGLSNVCGITFEIPVYTLVTNFRIISQRQFSSVGVFYRKEFASGIHEAIRLLDKEQVRLEAVCLDCEISELATPRKTLQVMENAFKTIWADRRPDVFLALADNAIVNNQSLQSFWMKVPRKNRIPVIAPLEKLAGPAIGLAVYAAEPDLVQLGIQAANQVADCMERGEKITAIGFQSVISVTSTVNQNTAREIGWKFKMDKLDRINSIVK